MMCNSGKNECRFPCSVYWWGDDRMLASNKGRGKAGAHLKWPRLNWGWDESRWRRSQTSHQRCRRYIFSTGLVLTRIIGSQTATHRDPSCVPIKISIERECVHCKDQFCKTNQSEHNRSLVSITPLLQFCKHCITDYRKKQFDLFFYFSWCCFFFFWV